MTISLKENMLLVYRHKEPQYLPLASDFISYKPVGMDFVREVPDGSLTQLINEDWFGQKWQYEPTVKASNPAPNTSIVKDITKWKDIIKKPKLEVLDWEGKAKEITKNWDRDKKLVKMVDRIGLWERMFSVIPFTDALCALNEEPEACYEFFSFIAEHKINLHNHFIKHFKPDIINMHDDYGSGQSMFMSPETWRKLVKPNLQKVIDNLTSQGVMYEHHCCGVMAPIAEEIADMGASSWNEVHIANNPLECKKKFGSKLAFVEGICSNQLIDKTETTEKEIREHIRETCDKMFFNEGCVIDAKLKLNQTRNEIVRDELIKYGQKFFKENRPELSCRARVL